MYYPEFGNWEKKFEPMANLSLKLTKFYVNQGVYLSRVYVKILKDDIKKC